MKVFFDCEETFKVFSIFKYRTQWMIHVAFCRPLRLGCSRVMKIFVSKHNVIGWCLVVHNVKRIIVWIGGYCFMTRTYTLVYKAFLYCGTTYLTSRRSGTSPFVKFIAYTYMKTSADLNIFMTFKYSFKNTLSYLIHMKY